MSKCKKNKGKKKIVKDQTALQLPFTGSDEVHNVILQKGKDSVETEDTSLHALIEV